MPELDPERSPSSLPATVGRYRVLGLLGQGGMGVVYEAEQTSPRRHVAVKVIRGGQTVDEHRIKMFEREAQTLALLEHPNIGAIYEAGRTDDGHHFFAMELVRGKTLDEWRRERPSIGAAGELRLRLALFRKIADAVHYAHRRGVIHRDLKPSNVLVGDEVETGEGSSSSGSAERLPGVKVLDFGLARITDGDIALASLTTDVGVIKGTLAYMSPEQARANPAEIDSRTDVYALGVMLFELLTGERPYDVAARSLPEAVRIICEDPPRRLTGRRGSGPDLERAVGKSAASDLETIVGKALSKEAEGRYESAAALSDDVLRYLTQQPILARPPSTLYQLRKFAARNRALVGGVVATFVVLVAGVVVSTVLALREAKQKRAAVKARADLQGVVDFQAAMLRRVEPDRTGHTLMEDLHGRVRELGERGSATPDEVATTLGVLDALNGTTTGLQLIAKEVLAPAAAAVDSGGLDPAVAVRLHQTLAGAYVHLGFFEEASQQRQRAVTLLEQSGDTAALLHERTQLAGTWSRAGRNAEAEELLRTTLDWQRRLPADERDVLETMDELGDILAFQNELDEAVEMQRAVLERRRRLFGPESFEAALSERHLAATLSSAGRYEEAEPLFLSGIEIGKRLMGAEDDSLVSSMTNLAGNYERQERYAEAEALYREVLDLRRRDLGDDHPNTLTAEHNLATVFLNSGRPKEAEERFRRVLEKRRRVLGERHPYTMSTTRNLGLACWDQGEDEDAEAFLKQAIEGYRRALGTENPVTLDTQADLAYWYASHERHAEAAGLFEGVVEARRVHAPREVAYYGTLSDLANEKKSLGEKAEAEALYEEALEGLREVDPSRVSVVAYNLACLAAVNGEKAKALERLRAAVEAGFDDAEWIQKDPELASLRGEGEFAEIVGLARGE